jgi:hypothetical protein
VFFCTGKTELKFYLGYMIRSAPPAPFKTAALTLAFAIAAALLAGPRPF